MDVARFSRHAAFFVHEHKPVCAYLECDAIGVGNSMKLPPIGGVEEVLGILRDPTPKRFLPAHSFHVIAPAVPFLCVVPILRQAEFVFEHGAQLGADSIVGFRVANSKIFGVNLVNGDMDMEVISIAMDDADTLMFAVSKLGAKTFFDRLESLCVRMFAGAEGNEQVVGAIGLCAGIKLLCGGDFAQGLG